jgi:hypothetical protein
MPLSSAHSTDHFRLPQTIVGGKLGGLYIVDDAFAELMKDFAPVLS